MAQLVVEMSGDEAKLWRSYQRVIDQQTKLERGLETVGRKGKKAGADVSAAFGSGAARELATYATGLLSLTAVIGGVNRALNELAQERAGAGQRLAGGVAGTRVLRQVAGTPEEYKQLLRSVEMLRRQPYGLTLPESQNLVFQTASAGLMKDIGTFGQLKRVAFDPEAAVEAVVKLQSGFGGEGPGTSGAGTARQIINKAIAAAGPSPVKAADIARVASIASPSWAAMGGHDEELLAMIGVASETFKSPETAAQRMTALTTAVQRQRHLIKAPGAATMSPFEIIEKLPQWQAAGKLRTEQGKKTRDILEFLGASEAVQGLQVLSSNMTKVQERIADIRAAEAATGGVGDLLAGRLGLAAVDPAERAVAAAEAAQQRLEVAQETRYGATERLAEEYIAETRAIGIERGGDFGPWMDEKSARALRRIQGDESFLRAQGIDQSWAGYSPELLGELRDFYGKVGATKQAARIDKQLEAMQTVANRTGSGAALRKPDDP